MKKIIILSLGLFFLVKPLWANDEGNKQEAAKMRNLGYVVVSPNGPEDGADFGPRTPGTRTSGIQEAFDFAKNNCREVYIVGGPNGSDGSGVVYNIDTTLHIPWGQDWHCDGGNYIMNFTITRGDCLHVDSQMTCDLKFGSVVAKSLKSGAVVKIKPTSEGPDNFTAFGVRTIQFNSIVGGGGRDNRGGGVGLAIDSSLGCIAGSQVLVGRIENCETGILLDQAKVGGQGIVGLVVECPLIRNCKRFIRANTGYFNRIDALLDAGDMAGSAVGVDITDAFQNVLTLAWQGSFAPGKALIFGAGAHDNLVCAMNLPLDGVTNKAGAPTNRVTPLKPVGFSVATPAVPASGYAAQNREPYAIVVTISTPGAVTSWKLADSNGKAHEVSSGLFAGQSFYLDPGDWIGFNYKEAPTWVWRALR